jgi:gluconokinase
MLIVVRCVSGARKSAIGSKLQQLGGELFDADDFHSHCNQSKMIADPPLIDEDMRPWLQELAKSREFIGSAYRLVSMSS